MIVIGHYTIEFELRMHDQIEMEEWIIATHKDVKADFDKDQLIGPVEIGSAVVIALMNMKTPGFHIERCSSQKLPPKSDDQF